MRAATVCFALALLLAVLLSTCSVDARAAPLQYPPAPSKRRVRRHEAQERQCPIGQLLDDQRCYDALNILPGWEKRTMYKACECPFQYTCMALLLKGQPLKQEHYTYYCHPNMYL